MPPAQSGLLKLIPVHANGQLAFAAYRLYPGASSYVPLALDVISLRESRVQSVVAFRDTGVFTLFGLPESLPLAA